MSQSQWEDLLHENGYPRLVQALNYRARAIRAFATAQEFRKGEPNPYDCSNPGNRFTGYEAARSRIEKGIKNGSSYAILGGGRCGKTSLLLRLEKDLQ